MALPVKQQGLTLDTLYELDDRMCVAAVREVLMQSQFNAAPLEIHQEHSQALHAAARLSNLRLAQHLIEVRGQTTKGRGHGESGYDGKERSVLIFGQPAGLPLRAVWRYLRKLGRWRPEGYALAAAEAIVSYHPSNARLAREFFGAWASAYVLHRVIWGQSTRFTYDARSVRFRFKSVMAVEVPSQVREEPFPELWDQKPLAYLRLLVAGRLSEVHRFAHGGLQRHPWIIEKASNEEVQGMLEAPYAPTVELALAELGKRFDPNKPDWALLGKLLEDQRPLARELGLRWVKLTSHLWTRELAQTLAFLESKTPEVRLLASSMVVAAMPGVGGLPSGPDQLLTRLKKPEVTGETTIATPAYDRALFGELLARLFGRADADDLHGPVGMKAIAGGLLARRPATFERWAWSRCCRWSILVAG